MTTLAERALEWRDRHAPGVYGEYTALLPYSVRAFFEKRGDARFKWGELTNSWGFAIDFVKHARWALHLQLGWPSIWIYLEPRRGSDEWDVNQERPGYGVSLFDRQFYVKFGMWKKFFPAPWSIERIRGEWLRYDGVWMREYRSKVPGDWEGWSEAREKQKAEEFVTVCDWAYQPRGMEYQHGKARLSISRVFLRPLWRARRRQRFPC